MAFVLPFPTMGCVSVDYRNPNHVTLAGRDRVVQALQNHDTLAAGKTWLVLLAGLTWCVLVTLAVAGIVHHLFDRAGVDTSFPAVWGTVASILLPLCFWYEHHTSGKFYENDIVGSSTGRSSSYGEWEMRSSEALWRFYVEVALSGPRWFMQGVGLRNQRSGADAAVLDRAAVMLLQLQAAGEGVQLGTLTLPDEQPTIFRRAMQYLVDHDWIGRSKDGGRVWLTTIAAQRLPVARDTVTSP